MQRVVCVKALDDFRIAVRFDDGVEGEVALRDRLFGSVFEPLRDPTFFRQVFVDDFGAVAWPNGADLAPDALYERVRNTTQIAS